MGIYISVWFIIKINIILYATACAIECYSEGKINEYHYALITCTNTCFVKTGFIALRNETVTASLVNHGIWH